MRNKFKMMLAATVLMIGCFSCSEDILQKVKPLSAYSEVDVFNDVGLLENYVNGFYLGIHHSMDSENAFTEGFTDNAYYQSKALNTKYFQGGYSAASTEEITRGTWANAYLYIHNANLLLEKTETSKVDTAKLTAFQGEAYFIRAYLYYDLLKFYGGVPIITKTFAADATDFSLPRASIEEVVALIVSDCNKAIDALPSITDQRKGRASKEAAMALKGRVLLFAASPLFSPTSNPEKWQAASDANKAVMDLATVTAVGTSAEYGKMFHGTLDGEIIFARYFTLLNQQAGWGGWGVNIWLYSGGFGGWSSSAPTQDLVDNYELTNGKLPSDPSSGYDPQNPYVNRDPRFYETILYQGASFYEARKGADRPLDYSLDKVNPGDATLAGYDSRLSKYFNGPTEMALTSYNFRKYTDEGKAADAQGADVNITPYIFFRKTEAYLNYAEAQIALGNDSEAKTALNIIRTNRGMPAITETGQALSNRYRRERRIEMALEDMRYFDIRRWKIGPETISKPAKGVIVLNINQSDFTKKSVQYFYNDITVILPNGSSYPISATPDPNRTWNDRLYWLAVPPTEIQRSGNKLQQNPLW